MPTRGVARRACRFRVHPTIEQYSIYASNGWDDRKGEHSEEGVVLMRDEIATPRPGDDLHIATAERSFDAGFEQGSNSVVEVGRDHIRGDWRVVMEQSIRSVVDVGFGSWVSPWGAELKRPRRITSPSVQGLLRGLAVWLACMMLMHSIGLVLHHGAATAGSSSVMCMRH